MSGWHCTYINRFCKPLITELVCAFLLRPTHTHGPGVLDAAGLYFLEITVPRTYCLTENILDKSHQAEKGYMVPPAHVFE